MTPSDVRRLFLVALSAVGVALIAAVALAGPTAPPPLPSASSVVTMPPSLRPAPPQPVPASPLANSPIRFFRELLAMTTAERQAALANRTPEVRQQILDKVREYESLKANERELRLSVTELRWYLRPLMTMPLTNRPAFLSVIPPEMRSLVEARLQEWDQVPPDAQAELLRLEPTLQYFTEIEGRTEQQRAAMVRTISPSRQKLLEKGIEQWHEMSEEQRGVTVRRFNQFFQLSSAEKQKALNTLSEPERKQIEKTLQTFGNLPPAQRAQCMRSFAKFTSMSVEERQQFLKNAERWKQMAPTERQAWRQLVNHLPPPLPQRAPPLPPTVNRSRPTPAVVTNGN